MIKTVVILYLVCLACYIPFSRTPDYFDAEKVPAVIRTVSDTLMASYSAGNKSYMVNVTYPLRSLKDGQRVVVIYDSSAPEKGVPYRLWGYWFTVNEVLFSAGLMTILFLSAVFITGKNSNIPYTQQELRKQRKYDL